MRNHDNFHSAGEGRLKGFGRAWAGDTGIRNSNRYLNFKCQLWLSTSAERRSKAFAGIRSSIQTCSNSSLSPVPQIAIVLNSNLVAYSILPSQSWGSAIEIHRDSRKFVEIRTMLLLIQVSYQDR